MVRFTKGQETNDDVNIESQFSRPGRTLAAISAPTDRSYRIATLQGLRGPPTFCSKCGRSVDPFSCTGIEVRSMAARDHHTALKSETIRKINSGHAEIVLAKLRWGVMPWLRITARPEFPTGLAPHPECLGRT